MNIKPEENLPIEEVDAKEEAAMKALFARTREDQDPGEHFFEAMQLDVMDQLDAPVQMQGGEVAPVHAAENAGSWWGRLWGVFTQHPTLAYGGAMALALLALVYWPAEQRAVDLDPVPKSASTLKLEELRAQTEAMANAEVVPQEALSGDVKVLVPHGLGDGELARLHALTREMSFDLLSEDDGWTGVESEQQAFLDDALDELEDSDLEWWEEQYDERTL